MQVSNPDFLAVWPNIRHIVNDNRAAEFAAFGGFPAQVVLDLLLIRIAEHSPALIEGVGDIMDASEVLQAERNLRHQRADPQVPLNVLFHAVRAEADDMKFFVPVG